MQLGLSMSLRLGSDSIGTETFSDSRDFRLGYETSDKLKILLLADILDRLRGADL